MGNCFLYVVVGSFLICCVLVYVLFLIRLVIIICRIKYLKYNKNVDFIILNIFVIYLDKSWCNILFYEKFFLKKKFY